MVSLKVVVTEHVGLVPAQLASVLPHPANVEPGAGVAVRTTFEPALNFAEQSVLVGEQLISCAAVLTVPLPLPALETYRVGRPPKGAETDLLPDITTVQVVARPHDAPAPPQPRKMSPATGTSVRVT